MSKSTVLMKMNKNLLAVLFLVLVCYGCSVDRYIPEGKYLYTKETVNITPDSVVENLDAIKTDLKAALRPEPVGSFLGGYPGLYYHYKAQREKPGFLNKFLNQDF